MKRLEDQAKTFSRRLKDIILGLIQGEIMRFFILFFCLILSLNGFPQNIPLPEHRKPKDCGGRQVNLPDQDPSAPKAQGDRPGQELSPEQKEAQKTFPKKVYIERPPLMARLKLLKDWDINPSALKNLLFYIDRTFKVPALKITTPEKKPVSLSGDQKRSVLDQLRDFEITLEEVTADKVANPVLSGDIPGLLGGEEPIASFELQGGEQQTKAEAYSVLFMTGLSDFDLPPSRLEELKDYLLRGGFLFADCASGSREFASGFKKIIRQMFPNSEFRLLPSSHPVYSTFFDLKKIRYTGKNKEPDGNPRMEGLDIGCRTAVIFSPDNLSCGWDGHMHGEEVDYEMHYEEALKFGVNLCAYASGYRELGKTLPKAPDLSSLKPYRGNETALSLVKWKGNYEPNPFGYYHFIRHLREKTSVDLRPEFLVVDPEKDDLTLHPLLFITGHGPLDLSDEAVARLGKHLENGAVLWAEACCGDEAFNHSFRALCQKLYPNETLSPLPEKHPVFSLFYEIKEMQWKPCSLKQLTGPSEAVSLSRVNGQVEGLYVKDLLKIVYCPFDLSCGWNKSPCLLCHGLEEKDAFRLGTNILLTLLTED